MRVREYGRPAMTLGVLAAILAAVPPGIALLPHSVGLLRAGAHAEEAAAASDAGDAGEGDATAGAQAAGRQGDVDGSRGSGGVSAGQSADGSAASGGGGSEADVGSATDDDASGGGGDGGGASATGESSAAGSGEGFSAGSVEADAPGRTPEVSRRAVSTGDISLGGVDAGGASEDAADTNAGAAAAVGVPTGTGKAGAGVPDGNAGIGNAGPARGEGGGGGAPETRGGNAGAVDPAAPAAEPARLRVVRAERSADGIAVFYSSQVRERIGGGRYEMQDASGRVVAERPVTPRDVERVRENVRLSGLDVVSDASLPEGSDVESVVVSQNGMLVRYRAGWTEDLTGDRYRFADPDGNMVVDRPATTEDRNRLLAIAGG